MSFATAIAFEPAAIWIGTREGILVRLADESAWAMRAYTSGPISALAVSSDGASLLVAGPAGAVSIFKTADGSLIDSLACAGPVLQGSIVAPRTYVTVDNERRGLLWSANGDGPIGSTPICEDGTTAVRFDRFGGGETGLTLLTAIDWMIWDRATNSVVSEHHPIDGMRLAYLDGLVGLSASGGHYFIHWDDYLVITTGTEDIAFEGPIVHRARCAALCDDARRLAVGTRDGELVVIEDGQTQTMALQPSTHAIRAVVWQADGARIGWIDAQGCFGVVDAKTGAEVVDRARGVELLG
ncbi:WD40 repeat domain-containing protein [Pseudomonas huaxiensis]|uniref:WD40 repeat domain-containing protein n=1 Tax=Pseudomonas huaxiensis TaxID=2213017 RepID=UPI000DA67C37|nr:hypothetical protein [Pseudomonas huaxiensis]